MKTSKKDNNHSLVRIAHYKCGTIDFKGCDFSWYGKPRPVDCPQCKQIYITWLNFEELRTNNII